MKRILRLLLCLILTLSLLALCACGVPQEETGTAIREDGYSEEYDAYGNLIKMVWYDENGVLEYVEEYEYDENGNCTEMAIYEDGALVCAYRYEYEEDCCIRALLYDESDTLMSVDEYIRDEDGMICGTYTFGYMGDYCYNCIEYDGLMNVVREEQYDENGEVYHWIEYVYDGEIRTESIEMDGYYKLYLHDENGAEIGYGYYDAEGKLIEEYYY